MINHDAMELQSFNMRCEHNGINNSIYFFIIVLKKSQGRHQEVIIGFETWIEISGIGIEKNWWASK